MISSLDIFDDFRMIWLPMVSLAVLSCVNAESQGVYFTQQWPGGFHGYFILRPDHTLHGWNATLTLSEGVDQFIVCLSRYEY